MVTSRTTHFRITAILTSSRRLAAPPSEVGSILVSAIHDRDRRVNAQNRGGRGAKREESIPYVPEQFLLIPAVFC